MSIAILVLSLVLLAVLVLIVAVLATPVVFHAMLGNDPVLTYRVVARPFAGVGPPLRLADSAHPRPKKKKRAKRDKSGKKKGRRFGVRTPVLASEIPRLAAGLLRCVQIEDLTVDAEFGLGDPAETGQIYGFLTPLIYGCGALPGGRLSIRPVFDRACLSGTADLRLSLTPIALVAPLARFGWNVFGRGR